MTYMFAWKEQVEACGAFPPVSIVAITMHRATQRSHICAECFAPIHIGERYTRTLYKEVDTGKMSQFKCHAVCPYEEIE